MAAFNTLLRVLTVTLLLVLAAAPPTRAWWAKGHMTVAEVARRNLNPDVAAKVQACATMLNKLGPFPMTTTMVEMGPWADDLKSYGLTTMATWHFIDTVYNPDNVAMVVDPATNMSTDPVTTVNVQSVIPMLVSAITAAGATSDSIVTSVANLIHYVGDIHMPLHAADLFSATYPLGDYGGNKQVVVVDAATGTTQKLHAFWDSMGEGPQADPARPLNATAYAALQTFVDGLLDDNAFTEAEMMNTDAAQMAAESFNLAVQNVYPGIANGTVLTQAYKDQAKVLCHQRVVLAGYRLATILNAALAKVALSTINKSTKDIHDAVEVTQTGDTYNYYAFSGVERGAAAGIFLSCFAIGCLLATAVAYAVVFLRRSGSRGGAKKPQPSAVPQAREGQDLDA